uniref:(northern house mosquito) hypothetical protein n=1 Tax=Culex pipiens TaxID=7175 RepID=A0A8D8P5S8_CULPI
MMPMPMVVVMMNPSPSMRLRTPPNRIAKFRRRWQHRCRPSIALVRIRLDRRRQRGQRDRVPLLNVLRGSRLRPLGRNRGRLLSRQRVVPLEARRRRTRTLVAIIFVAANLRQLDRHLRRRNHHRHLFLLQQGHRFGHLVTGDRHLLVAAHARRAVVAGVVLAVAVGVFLQLLLLLLLLGVLLS